MGFGGKRDIVPFLTAVFQEGSSLKVMRNFCSQFAKNKLWTSWVKMDHVSWYNYTGS